MTKYQPLTKIVTNDKGTEFVTCCYYGTDTCQKIHKPEGCNGCRMFAAILNQLHAFEADYMAKNKNEEVSNE